MKNSATAAIRLPAEFEPHAGTIMAWPTTTRKQFWGGHLNDARIAWANVANTIVKYEPVLMVAEPGHAANVKLLCPAVSVIELPIDDSWARDISPLFVERSSSSGPNTLAVGFGFNGWGGFATPYERDNAFSQAVSKHLGVPYKESKSILEGGSIATNGAGLFIVTERCLLNINRTYSNKLARSKEQIERLLTTNLGSNKVIWLPDGIFEDEGTDGHVDNVVTFFSRNQVLLQGCDDKKNKNHAIFRNNLEILTSHNLNVTVIDKLPYSTVSPQQSQPDPCPYLNLYIINGAVIVPISQNSISSDDVHAMATVQKCFPSRKIEPVSAQVLAFGGGGPHCITMQIPQVLL